MFANTVVKGIEGQLDQSSIFSFAKKHVIAILFMSTSDKQKS